jgi:hypothetical protein
MNPRALLPLSFLFALVSSACAHVTNPLQTFTVQGCVQKNCTDAEASAYKACEASCRQTYGGK